MNKHKQMDVLQQLKADYLQRSMAAANPAELLSRPLLENATLQVNELRRSDLFKQMVDFINMIERDSDIRIEPPPPPNKITSKISNYFKQKVWNVIVPSLRNQFALNQKVKHFLATTIVRFEMFEMLENRVAQLEQYSQQQSVLLDTVLTTVMQKGNQHEKE